MTKYRVTRFTYRKEICVIEAATGAEAVLLRYMGELGEVEFDQDVGILKVSAEEIPEDEITEDENDPAPVGDEDQS